MVRAHFTIRLGDTVLPGSGAQWVADIDSARSAARTIVQGLMRQHGGDPRLLEAAVVVTDADGAILLDLPFFDALYMPVDPVLDPDRRPRVPRAVRPARLDAALNPVRRLAGALSARLQLRPGS